MDAEDRYRLRMEYGIGMGMWRSNRHAIVPTEKLPEPLQKPAEAMQTTYDEFVAAVEARPAGVSPLLWMAANHPALPPKASEWMLRWLRESRS